MRTQLRRRDAVERGGRDDEEARPSAHTALLQLQHQAGNRATTALVGALRSGAPIPPVQRLHLQRDDTLVEAEDAKKEAAKKAAAPATPATVPAPATPADATAMALILEADGPGLGVPTAEIDEAKQGVPEVLEEYNTAISAVADMDEDERAALGVAHKPKEEPAPDDAAVGKVIAALSPEDGASPQPTSASPSAAPDPIEADIEETESETTRASVSLSASAHMLGVQPAVHDSDSKVAAVLSQSDAKVTAALHTVTQVVDAAQTTSATVPAVNSPPRSGAASGPSSSPAPAKKPGLAKRLFSKITGQEATASGAVKHVDSAYAPGIEASPVGALAAADLFKPLAQKAKDSPLGMEGQHQDGESVFSAMGHVAAAGNLLGALTAVGVGIKDFVVAWTKKKGRHVFTSKDSRHALGKIAVGATAIGTTILSIIGGAVDTLATVLGPVGAAVGSVASFIASGRAFRQSYRASVRRKRSRNWEHAIKHHWMADTADPKKATTKQMRAQDHAFLVRLLAAVRALKIKAGRKADRRFASGMIAATSGVGGIFLLMALVGAVGLANVWNPVGWAIGGLATVAALGLGIYKLYRFIKRNKSRKKAADRTEAKGGQRTAETKDAHAAFVHTEINCKTTPQPHENHTGHENAMTLFVREVLRKDPDKVKSRDADYIEAKWSSW